MGRFINTDDPAYLGADGSALGYNLFVYCGNNPTNKIDKTGNFGLAIGIFIGGSAIIGGLAGALTAACTGGNVLEGMLEGAALGAVAATATIFVPQLIAAVVPATMAASTVTALSVAATFTASCAGGMIVDYATQRVSHEFSESGHEEFNLNEGRLIKTGFATGITGVIPTYGNPAESVVNAVGSLIMGFDASFINAAIEIAITKLVD